MVGRANPFMRGVAEPMPAWSELERFAIQQTPQRQTRLCRRERILVSHGLLQVAGHGFAQNLRAGQFFDLPEDCDAWELRGSMGEAEFVRFSGMWGRELGGCGTFVLENVAEGEREPPEGRKGDPFSYRKLTRFDRHYHDCQEFWLMLQGAAVTVLGDQLIRLEAGQCLAIPTGWHHDLSDVLSPMRAVYLETTLTGRKRIGHLWEHRHGKAVPAAL